MGLFRDMLAIGGDSSDSSGNGTGPRTVRERASRSITGAVGSERVEAERVPIPVGEIEKYWRMYRTVPFIRASFNQFCDDVMANGSRMEADTDGAKRYLDNWAETAGVVGAERNRPLQAILREIPTQLLARGTVFLEHAPAESDADRTAGVSFINPKTITPYRASDTNLLLRPDDTQYSGAKLTDDGKAAAYVQFDGGPDRRGEDERRLTLNDVTKLAIDADPHDVFGTSRVAPVAPRIEALRSKLQDNDRAIASMGWGQWFVGFGHEKVTNEDGSETIVEWADGDMDDFMDDLSSVEPGDIEGHDGTIDIQNLPGEVANIIDQLRYETHYILTAMPAPTYAIGFESDINQFVIDGQEKRHERRVSHFQDRMERELRPLVKSVAAEGGYRDVDARLKLEPPEEDSPILNLSGSEIDKMERFAAAFEKVSGGKPRTLLPDEVIREQVLQVENVAKTGGYTPNQMPNSLAAEDAQTAADSDVTDLLDMGPTDDESDE